VYRDAIHAQNDFCAQSFEEISATEAEEQAV